MGASLARAFASEGYAVALLSRRAESSEPVAAEIRSRHGKALVLPTDVTQRDAVRRSVEEARSQFGPVTVLAYNASGYGRGAFLELDPQTISQSFQAGVMGAVHLTQAVLLDMLTAGHGFISFTGATAALRGRAGFAPLAIAKSGLRMLGQSLAREFHPKGVHVVHLVIDGQIDTPRLRARDPDRDSETLIPPAAIANCVIHALKQPFNAWSHEIDIRPRSETF